jgi:hypothetical protein
MMHVPNTHAKIDQELRRQMTQAVSGNEIVQAVFTLKPPNAKEKSPKPDEVEKVVKELVKRVEHETGIEPEDLNVFKYLGSFVVEASLKFVAKLLEQKEIASAIANRQPESLVMSPHRKRLGKSSEKDD